MKLLTLLYWPKFYPILGPLNEKSGPFNNPACNMTQILWGSVFLCDCHYLVLIMGYLLAKNNFIPNLAQLRSYQKIQEETYCNILHQPAQKISAPEFKNWEKYSRFSIFGIF